MWTFSKALLQDYENSHCSQEQVAASLLENCLDGAPSAPLNSINTQGMCWSPDKTTAAPIRTRYGTTYEPLTASRGKDVLTWCQAGSPAPTYPVPESKKALQDHNQDCGLKWRALSVRYDRDTCSWKTHQTLFDADLDWSLLTLPKWGMMLSGELWELMTPALHTKGNASGLWPSPTSRDYKDSPGMSFESTNPDGSRRDRTDLLPRRVYATLPTPTAGDANNATRTSGDYQSLTRTVGGSLNPTWVAWLMGWPHDESSQWDWTTLTPAPPNVLDSMIDPWHHEPNIPRVDTNIPQRVNRLKCLGNGMVPQCAAMAWTILSNLLANRPPHG